MKKRETINGELILLQDGGVGPRGEVSNDPNTSRTSFSSHCNSEKSRKPSFLQKWHLAVAENRWVLSTENTPLLDRKINEIPVHYVIHALAKNSRILAGFLSHKITKQLSFFDSCATRSMRRIRESYQDFHENFY